MLLKGFEHGRSFRAAQFIVISEYGQYLLKRVSYPGVHSSDLGQDLLQELFIEGDLPRDIQGLGLANI